MSRSSDNCTRKAGGSSSAQSIYQSSSRSCSQMVSEWNESMADSQSAQRQLTFFSHGSRTKAPEFGRSFTPTQLTRFSQQRTSNTAFRSRVSHRPLSQTLVLLLLILISGAGGVMNAKVGNESK